ncbi:exodeoxyribonuclease VII small subunit [Pseudactinotalea sp. Z1732]|uniref:exodeoxyribonuclease VII small subunit n=1 Tax=Micrococcales TaxID=85006 RepID=UPI003C7C289A
MTDPSQRPDVNTLSYEQARDELIQVVASLENGSASLEDSLALWERGEALADRCQGWLDAAKERLAAASADHAAEPDANGTDADQASAPVADEGDQ